jgi:hypothetical protein
MNPAIEILKRERDATTDRLRQLKVQLKALDHAIEILEGEGGAPVIRERNVAGELVSLVVDIVTSAGAEGVSPAEVGARLRDAGRETSPPSVTSTLSRMKKAGRLVNNDRGLWFTPDYTASEVAASEAVSGSVREEGGYAEASRPPSVSGEIRTLAQLREVS